MIIIVDDDKNILQSIEDTFDLIGFNIKILKYTDPLKALEKIENNTNKIVLLITDIRMPKMSGIELYNKVRTINNTLPIILMSGFPMAELIDDDNVYFMYKPFTHDTIDKILKKILKNTSF